ncbi:MAG TPA: ABC transporter substrate-binding protein [Candidatus Kapabacteria bacterium]|jgi:iron complex transport system substrate-binding protein
MRIVSLLPSATEICFALGLGESVVGVTHECDFPTDARSKPKVTTSRTHEGLSSSEIDQMVRGQLSSGESLYTLDAGMLEDLKPDLILTQQLCTVCAVSIRQVQRIASGLSSKPQVVNLEPRSMKEVFQTFRKVADICGISEKAASTISGLETRYRNVKHLVRRQELQKPKVQVLEWIDPPYASGHWIPEIVNNAGGEVVIGFKEKPAQEVKWEQVWESKPDFIIIAACGMRVDWQKKETEIILARLGLTGLARESIGAPSIWICNGSDYFSRPGPRLVDTTELLATLLHPELRPHYGSRFREGTDYAHL